MTKSYFKAVAYSLRLSNNLPQYQEKTRAFDKIFSWDKSQNIYLLVSKFSKRMMIPELNNGRSKMNVVNIDILPLKQITPLSNTE